MKIHFTGRNIEVTPALKSFTEEKMERLHHLDKNISSLNITFHVENVTHTAEATAHVYGVDIHASAQSSDMYVAIDLLVDKMISQIKKHKEKMTDHHR